MDEKLRVDVLETSGDKEDISHIPNSMFDQNLPPQEIVNRDYFEVLYDGEIKPLTDQIVMTRSMYLDSIADIERDTRKEIKDVIKHIPLNALYCFAFVALAIVSVKIIPFWIVNSLPCFDLVAFLLLGSVVGFFVASFCLTFSTIKRIVRAKKARVEALKTLEERKKECMSMGTYDAGR